ncbi:MAG: excinuclease ABC subunit B [Candidatus Omnitrophica bacterium CG1_02_44_16]|nr:MAG: excinuclease ABC subunit B [Candidatus Omnitrophica bacterium CG1_02_44_16]PIZ83466.1 MAG: excinuclease ABC subunit B [Candidatus Omnitrophica bacterium CG_4_10_14_0_2_um_filter_44_9]
MPKFKLKSKFKTAGDQAQAIKKLAAGLTFGKKKYQTLLGVTGSGKTFTMANVIEKINKPTLVISHNKTLAAQLYFEFKEFFPENAVEYFVSYYDYYQPEAYIPATDTYIEKDSSVNDRLDRLRLSSTTSLLSRPDTLIVASVSCIYNLGSPKDYAEFMVFLEIGQTVSRNDVIKKLIGIQYERNDIEFTRGKVRVKGDVVDIFPAYSQKAVRLELIFDKIAKIYEIDPVSGKKLCDLEKIGIYPAKHYIVSQDAIEAASNAILIEMDDRLRELRSQNKLLQAQRLEQRTKYDMEMIREVGYCHGIENYSRHLSFRAQGSRPSCLLDYFKEDFLVFVDESHVTIPQIRGMYEGDKARKEVLVDFGFRLPSCLDNRPLKFEEFETMVRQEVFVSATPSQYEIKKSCGISAEQVIRPTGIPDPETIVKKTEGQIEDLEKLIRERAKKNERVLVTTLTKKMAEDLSQYFEEKGLRVRYLHSDIVTIERIEILRQLRKRDFDCLVGVNLLREGLDLPEVSLVAILDADKEGFLRSAVSLIQLSGRAARNINGQVVMYADTVTPSMRIAINEGNRRRNIQLEYNIKHHITSTTIKKEISESLKDEDKAKTYLARLSGQNKDEFEFDSLISLLQHDMELAALNLKFEEAADLRDEIKRLKSVKKADFV